MMGLPDVTCGASCRHQKDGRCQAPRIHVTGELMVWCLGDADRRAQRKAGGESGGERGLGEVSEVCLGTANQQPDSGLPLPRVLSSEGAEQGRVISLAEYRADAMRTFPGELLRQERRDYLAMKLVEEAGEFMSLICKAHYQGEPLDQQRITEELGDVLWALHVNLAEYGLTVEQIMVANVEKRGTRYPAK